MIIKHSHLTAYFVLFIFSALFNGFNVRDERFGIFKRLNENPDFLKVFFIIMLVQIMIVNAAAIPFQVFIWIGKMFSCIPFGAKGLDCYSIVINDDDSCGLSEKISVWLWKIGEVFMMKIVVAIDSLKGSLTSIQAGEAIEKGIKNSCTFQFICRECDSKLFSDYEDEISLCKLPTRRMMAEIDVKNSLLMLYKRLYELPMYESLAEF